MEVPASSHLPTEGVQACFECDDRVDFDAAAGIGEGEQGYTSPCGAIGRMPHSSLRNMRAHRDEDLSGWVPDNIGHGSINEARISLNAPPDRSIAGNPNCGLVVFADSLLAAILSDR